MLTIAKLFGKSPFAPLQTHMDKVASCFEKLTPLFDALDRNDRVEITNISAEISRLEHEADLTKNDIRNHLPKSLFLPIDRSSFLEILALQDAIADQTEDIGILMTLHFLEHYEEFQPLFRTFLDKNFEAFQMVRKVIRQLHDLLEASFGGVEAEKVKKMIEEIAYQEHQVDILQYDLLKKLFLHAEKLSNAGFYLWRTLFKEVSNLSNLSEKLANRIRMILELK